MTLEYDEAEVDRFLDSPGGPVGKYLERVGQRVRNEVIRLLSRRGTGVVYFRRTVQHQASAPGAPPSVDTGRLRASITSRLVRTGEGRLAAQIGSDVEYARYLELGTSRMAPRPYLRPALHAVTSPLAAGEEA